jgi:hypothetical protein
MRVVPALARVLEGRKYSNALEKISRYRRSRLLRKSIKVALPVDREESTNE